MYKLSVALVLLHTCYCTTQFHSFDVERGLYELDKIAKDNATGTCQELLNGFSFFSSQFIFCANQHAKPISMCRECLHHLIGMNDNYQALSENSESGLLCKDMLTSQDRVEIVQATYQYIAAKRGANFVGLWNKGNCDSCYTQPLSRNSTLSEETEKFFHMQRLVEECFQEHPYEEDSPRNSSSACQDCLTLYQNLSDFYKSQFLDSDALFTEHICFDIVDAMNMTQRRWGEKFNCGRKIGQHLILLIAITIVLLMPVVFYSIVRFAETSAEERVITQRHITDFFDQSLRRISFNRRSRFSRGSRVPEVPESAATQPRRSTDSASNHTSNSSRYSN